MSPRRAVMRAKRSSFPRVSGDEPFNESLDIRLKMFSPRERG